MANKEEPTSMWVFVFWLLIAIIGTGLLFTGLQNSVLGDSIPTSILLIVVGIILIFIGLAMVLGKANIEAEDVEMPGAKKEKKK